MKLGFRTFIDSDLQTHCGNCRWQAVFSMKCFRQVTTQNRMDVREVKTVKRVRWLEFTATYTQRFLQDMTSVLTENERECIKGGKTHQERYVSSSGSAELLSRSNIFCYLHLFTSINTLNPRTLIHRTHHVFASSPWSPRFSQLPGHFSTDLVRKRGRFKGRWVADGHEMSWVIAIRSRRCVARQWARACPLALSGWRFAWLCLAASFSLSVNLFGYDMIWYDMIILFCLNDNDFRFIRNAW
jgi:hypothetical protein